MCLNRLLESEYTYYKLVKHSKKYDGEWAYYVLHRENHPTPQYSVLQVFRI